MHELSVTRDLIAGATTLPQRHYAQEMLRTYDTVRWFVFRPLPFRQGEFRSLGLRLLKFYKTTFYSSFILASIADRCCRHLLEITVMSVASTTNSYSCAKEGGKKRVPSVDYSQMRAPPTRGGKTKIKPEYSGQISSELDAEQHFLLFYFLTCMLSPFTTDLYTFMQPL